MIALLDNGQDLNECADEIGCDVGQLLTPLTRYRLRDPAKPWAIDNGGYSGLDIPAFRALLERERHHKHLCLFVTVPDVVTSARRTLELFDHWKPLLGGWRLALACQDGQENLPIPWKEIGAVFIGGSTNWKASDVAGHIIRAAKAMDSTSTVTIEYFCKVNWVNHETARHRISGNPNGRTEQLAKIQRRQGWHAGISQGQSRTPGVDPVF